MTTRVSNTRTIMAWGWRYRTREAGGIGFELRISEFDNNEPLWNNIFVSHSNIKQLQTANKSEFNVGELIIDEAINVLAQVSKGLGRININ